MNEYATGAIVEPRMSRIKYRLMMRNRNGLQGRQAMIVCTNFRVTADERLFYADLRGDLQVVALKPGDYFEVKVL